MIFLAFRDFILNIIYVHSWLKPRGLLLSRILVESEFVLNIFFYYHLCFSTYFGLIPDEKMIK